MLKVRLTSCFAKVLRRRGRSAGGLSFSVAYSLTCKRRLQRAGVTDAAALLATLFGDSGRIDTPGHFAPANGAAIIYAAGPCGAAFRTGQKRH